jgi:hypothetical protein
MSISFSIDLNSQGKEKSHEGGNPKKKSNVFACSPACKLADMACLGRELRSFTPFFPGSMRRHCRRQKRFPQIVRRRRSCWYNMCYDLRGSTNIRWTRSVQ